MSGCSDMQVYRKIWVGFCQWKHWKMLFLGGLIWKPTENGTRDFQNENHYQKTGVAFCSWKY